MRVLKEGKEPKSPRKSLPDENLPRYLAQRKEYREIRIKVILKQLEKMREKGLITKKEFENRKRQIGV